MPGTDWVLQQYSHTNSSIGRQPHAPSRSTACCWALRRQSYTNDSALRKPAWTGKATVLLQQLSCGPHPRWPLESSRRQICKGTYPPSWAPSLAFSRLSQFPTEWLVYRSEVVLLLIITLHTQLLEQVTDVFLEWKMEATRIYPQRGFTLILRIHQEGTLISRNPKPETLIPKPYTTPTYTSHIPIYIYIYVPPRQPLQIPFKRIWGRPQGCS